MSDDREVTITAYPDGPLLVRGNYRVLNVHGQQIEQSGRTVALCRCGKSKLKPWCDGTHKLIGFTDTS